MIDFKATRDGEIDVEALARDLERFPDDVADIVERAVDREREGHRYVNRSGDTEASTQAITIDSGGTSLTRAQQGGAGWFLQGKWSRFVELMERASKRIDTLAEKVGK